jgi:hypothetical protein
MMRTIKRKLEYLGLTRRHLGEEFTIGIVEQVLGLGLALVLFRSNAFGLAGRTSLRGFGLSNAYHCLDFGNTQGRGRMLGKNNKS